MPEPKGRNIAPLLQRSREEEEEQEQAPANRSGRNVAAMLSAQSEAKDPASPTHVMGIRLPTDEDFAQAEERQAAQFAEFDAELERMGQRIIDRRSSDPENIGWAPSQKRYKHPVGGEEFTIYSPQEFAATKLGRMDGAMMSWGDEIYGMVDKKAGDRRRALKRYAEEHYPNQYAWGEGDGATFNAVATMPVGLKAADKVVAAIPKIGNTAKAAITGASSAAAWDGVDQLGGGEGDLIDRVGQYDPVRGGVAAGLGATLGGTIAKAAEGVSGLVDKVRSPDLDGLRALKDAAYKEAEGLGVEYSPESFTDLVAKIEGALDEMEIEPMAHQKVLGVLTRLQKRVTGDPISMMRLDKMRQAVRKQLNGPGATDTDKMFGRLIIDEIDEFIDSGIGAAAGIGKKGAEAIRKARGLHTVFKKTELLEDAYETASLRASSTGSGGNFENALRQEMRKIYQSKKLNASFSPEELKVMRQVIEGAPIQKMFRAYGKLDPFKHGLASMFASANVGNAVFSGGTPASIAPLAFQAGAIPARMAGEALAAGKFDKLARTVRRGANAYTNRAEEMAQAMGGTTGGGFGREARSLEEGIEQASRGEAPTTQSSSMAEAMNGPQVAPQRPMFGRRAPEPEAPPQAPPGPPSRVTEPIPESAYGGGPRNAERMNIPQEPTTLTSAVRNMGGIKTRYTSEGVQKNLSRGDFEGIPGLINDRSGKGADDMVRALQEDGFDIASEDDLYRALDNERMGVKTYRIGEGEIYEAELDAYEAMVRGDVEPDDPVQMGIPSLSDVRSGIARLMGNEDGTLLPKVFKGGDEAGLPMDEASRMARAREMGFDTDQTLYHGTQSQIESFEANKGIAGKGVYLTSDSEYAGVYAQNRDHFDAQLRGKEPSGGYFDGGSIYPLFVRGRIADQATTSRIASELGGEFSNEALNAKLAELGYSGRVGYRGSDVVIFDPKNIRSKYARFDPDQSDSPILTNGLPAFDRSKPGRKVDVPGPGSKGSGIQMQLKDGTPTTIGKIYELATSINPETNKPWTRAEIADEMMISKNQVSVTYHKLRKNGYAVDVVPSESPLGARGEKGAMMLALKRQGLSNGEIANRVNAVYGKDVVHGGTDTNAAAVGVTLSKLRGKMRDEGKVVDFGMGLALPSAAASMMLNQGEQSEEEIANLLGTDAEKRAAMARAMLGGY